MSVSHVKCENSVWVERHCTTKYVEADRSGLGDVGVQDLADTLYGGDFVGVGGREPKGERDGGARVETAGGCEDHLDVGEVIVVRERDGDLSVREGLVVGVLELLQDQFAGLVVPPTNLLVFHLMMRVCRVCECCLMGLPGSLLLFVAGLFLEGAAHSKNNPLITSY